MNCSKVPHESTFLQRSTTLAITASHIANVGIIKPTYVIAKSSLELIKSFWCEGIPIIRDPTIPEALTGMFIWWYYPTLQESATKCGAWSILSNASSTLITSVANSCLSKESWSESWECVKDTYSTLSKSDFFTAQFIDPFSEGNCKLFQAHCLTVLPAGVFLALPFGWRGLKKVVRIFASNIHEAYYTPPLEKTSPCADKPSLPSSSPLTPPISPEFLQTIEKELQRLKNEDAKKSPLTNSPRNNHDHTYTSLQHKK